MVPKSALWDVFCAKAPKVLGEKHISKSRIQKLTPILFMIDFPGQETHFGVIEMVRTTRSHCVQ